LIRYKYRKLKPHLIKCYFIMIKQWICLTHQHRVQLFIRQLFWVPKPCHYPGQTHRSICYTKKEKRKKKNGSALTLMALKGEVVAFHSYESNGATLRSLIFWLDLVSAIRYVGQACTMKSDKEQDDLRK
jgi:hypothetical protein